LLASPPRTYRAWPSPSGPPLARPGACCLETLLLAAQGCPAFSDDAACAARDFLLGALGEAASEIFWSVAALLDLDAGIVFVDSTSAYRELEVAAELAGTADRDGDEVEPAEEEGDRRSGHTKDHRGDLPQVVIAMAVTRDGIPVRCWTFPGSAADQKIIRKGEGRPGIVEPAPAGAGRRPRVRLRGQPGLPRPGRRALHPRREAPEHQQ
jgi:hypothetical protein